MIGKLGEVLEKLVAVGSRSHFLDEDVLDASDFLRNAEHLLLLVILGLEVVLGHLHVLVVNRLVIEVSQVDIALLVGGIEIELGLNGVGKDARCKQGLIFFSEQLLAELLLLEEHELVDFVVLLSQLWIGIALSLVIAQEFLVSIDIETSGLLIHESGHIGHFHQHVVGALCQNILHFLGSDCETQFIGLVLDDLVLHETVPCHSPDLVVVGLGCGNFCALHELLDIGLVVLCSDFLSQDFTYATTSLPSCCLTGTEHVAGNESKKAKSDNDNQECAFASDFS